MLVKPNAMGFIVKCPEHFLQKNDVYLLDIWSEKKIMDGPYKVPIRQMLLDKI